MDVPSLLQQAAALYQGADMDAVQKFHAEVQRLYPRNADVWNKLSVVAARTKRFSLAMRLSEIALRISPNSVVSLVNMANHLMQQRQEEKALPFFQAAVTADPRNPLIYVNYGQCLYQLRRHDEALEVLQKAIQYDPSLVPAYVNLATLYFWKGNMKAAEEAILKGLNYAPNHSALHAFLANTRTYTQADMPQIQKLERQLQHTSKQPQDAANYAFALGKIYNDLKDYEHAARCYRQGNEWLKTLAPFNRDAFLNAYNATLRIFTKEFFAERQGFGHPSEAPLFIIGLPRSGTTLVHQILASHPAVLGVGENPYFLDTFVRLPAQAINKTAERSPHLVAAQLTAIDIHAMAEQYLANHRPYMTGQSFICNKSPHNIEILGFIALLFPKARVIHCRRDLRDTALSIYCQKFTEGNRFANDFSDIAYYHHHCDALMAQWHQILPTPIREMSYEALLEKPEETVRGLLDFCGLEWNEACLNFHSSDTPVETASAWQVRQPLYTTSLKRWQRYAPYLPELEAVFP